MRDSSSITIAANYGSCVKYLDSVVKKSKTMYDAGAYLHWYRRYGLAQVHASGFHTTAHVQNTGPSFMKQLKAIFILINLFNYILSTPSLSLPLSSLLSLVQSHTSSTYTLFGLPKGVFLFNDTLNTF